jgi:hypothetical protein
MKNIRLIALSLVMLLCACTAEQIAKQSYDISSGWKVEECRGKIDPIERDRCSQSARMSYDDFKQLQAESRKE